MKSVIIIQARTNSSRLPGKVLQSLAGQAMIFHVLDRARQSDADDVILATSREASDDELAQRVMKQGYPVFRGSLDDVLDRFYMAALELQAGTIIRLTGDCPLVDPELINRCLDRHQQGDCDYVSTAYPNPSYPDGLDVEVFSIKILEKTWKTARKPSEREHVTPYIWKHPELFRLETIASPTNLSHLRWTVDEPRDMEFMQQIFTRIDPGTARMKDVLAILKSNPKIQDINHDIARNEGYLASLENDAKVAKG